MHSVWGHLHSRLHWPWLCCHIHVLSARRNSALHCGLSRVGVRLWMAWVDETMLPALSLWHFHIELRSWKDERNKLTSSSFSSRPACPAWSMVQKVAREASIPSVCVRVIVSACHFLWWLILDLRREGLEPFDWWVLLHFRWFFMFFFIIIKYYMVFRGVFQMFCCTDKFIKVYWIYDETRDQSKSTSKWRLIVAVCDFHAVVVSKWVVFWEQFKDCHENNL